MYQKWLQAFHYVARENSFTKAASCLNVGQPTISTHVSHLEEYFGVELFLRQRRKILLTLAGENLYAIPNVLPTCSAMPENCSTMRVGSSAGSKPNRSCLGGSADAENEKHAATEAVSIPFRIVVIIFI